MNLESLNWKLSNPQKKAAAMRPSDADSAGLQERERASERGSHLKDCESEGVSQVFRGLEHLLPVVAVQVDAAEHVQLGVDPVQPAFDQIWGGGGEDEKRGPAAPHSGQRKEQRRGDCD